MMQVTMSSKGEIVIPKKIREYLGLIKERSVILEVKDKVIYIHQSPNKDIAKEWKEKAKKENVDTSKWIYGDKLYEWVF